MTRLIALSIAIAGAAPAPSVQATSPDARVVARAGSVTVTLGDLLPEIREARLSGNPKRVLATITVDGLEEMARTIAERRLLAQAARARRLDTDPEGVRAIERAIETLLADRLIDAELAALDTSTDALRRYYDAHQDEFRSRPRRQAHHIVVKTREEAEAARAEVKAGAAFADVASARNVDSTKGKGGDLGWIERDVMVKVFEDALFALERPGDISGIVQTNFGHHLIQLDAIDPGTLPPFELVTDAVATAVKRAALVRLRTQVVEPHPMTFDRDALAALAGEGKK
jgi:peptidyl-prolyl cis-trans isomerase C